MPQKTAIVSKLGEASLLVPKYLNDGLLANDRVKYYFALLQGAADHALSGRGDPAPELRAERIAVGETDAALDEVAAGSQSLGDGQLRIPRIADVHQRILACIADMARPLTAMSADGEDRYSRYAARLDVLKEAAPDLADDRVPGSYIAAMTGVDRSGGDSLHLLVMDLHKELNRLQADIAQESIDGASAYGLEPGDRALVVAFQEGLNRTAPLKFDHPGLATTATRSGDRLLIQNDIGTTDAHVLVVQVMGREVTLTYTDVHVARLRFFQSLFDAYSADWRPVRGESSADLAEGERFYTGLGRFEAQTPEALSDYLRFLGSRLVFLIDWNKARKRLRRLAGKKPAVELLTWAAKEDYGHRAFLELGGEELVFRAVRRSSGVTVEYGQSLDALLGSQALFQYLKFVLRTASVGLRSGKPSALIEDEVKAELLSQFQGVQGSMLELAAGQTEIIHDLACAVRDALLRCPVPVEDESLPGVARRARDWEHQGDGLVRRSAELANGRQIPEALTTLVRKADDIADSLEEASFLLGLLPRVPQDAEILKPTRELAALVVESAQELVKCVAAAALVGRGAERDDVQDFLEAVNRVVTIERETDVAERRVTETLVERAADPRQLHLFSELVKCLEKSTDAMARSAVALRDFALGEAMSA